MKNNTKPYVVYSKKLMRYLLRKDILPITITPNDKYPDKMVFIYKNDDRTIKEIEKYLTNLK